MTSAYKWHAVLIRKPDGTSYGRVICSHGYESLEEIGRRVCGPGCTVEKFCLCGCSAQAWKRVDKWTR